MPEFISQNFDVSIYVHRFPNLAAHACKQTKLHSFGIQILNKSYQQIQKIPRNSYNIVSFTHNRYFTCFEAVQKLTVQKSLNVTSNDTSYLSMTPHSVETCSAELRYALMLPGVFVHILKFF